MTAIMTSQFSSLANPFSFNFGSGSIWQADIYDFEGEMTSVEIEADNEDEAYSKALEAAAAEGIDANYISVNRF